MKILISGSRTWDKRGPIEAFMTGMFFEYKDVEFIVGDCPTGVDDIVLGIAKRKCYPITVFTADWDVFGKKAGPVRNSIMVEQKPDICFAFRDEGKSPGTDNCVYLAQCAGIPTYVVHKMNPLGT